MRMDRSAVALIAALALPAHVRLYPCVKLPGAKHRCSVRPSGHR